MRRVGSALMGAAILCSTIAVSSSAGSATAAPKLTPSTTTVAVGGTLTVSQTGCDRSSSDTGYYLHPQIAIVNGTGAQARVIGWGSAGAPIAIPGWIDRSRPTVVTGICVQERWVDQSSGPESIVVSRYPDVTLKITAATQPVTSPAARLLRTTAAGGQVARIVGSGCPRGSIAYAGLVPGAAFDVHRPIRPVSYGLVASGSQSFVLDLPLNAFPTRTESDSDGVITDNAGPLPEGPYSVYVACAVEPQEPADTDPPVWMAPTQRLTIKGTNPSTALSATVGKAPNTVDVAGSGCPGQRAITATFSGSTEDDGARRIGSSLDGPKVAARVAPDTKGFFSEAVRGTAAADGTWALTWSSPRVGFHVSVVVDCGRADGDGFRYVTRSVYVDASAPVGLSRISPTAAAPGDRVTGYLSGECTGASQLAVSDKDGKQVASVPISGTFAGGTARASFTAPTAPGTYLVRGTCGDKLGYATDFEVFTPTTLADPAPLPAGPTTGWPVDGKATTYHGRIGPISLPAMNDMASADRTSTSTKMTTPPAAGMSSSGYGIAVPRPEGDFAIKRMSFNLVDVNGKPVAETDAHLHHFVIGNLSSNNPACPTGTFGLPGEIVGATGAEKTTVDFGPGPYGLRVKRSDKWSGAYQVMNQTTKAQTVYLTYDFTIRRDVKNIRPLRNYFGSATGCSSFTWNVDGSTGADTQSTYVTVAADGLLVGGGGHLHNGGRDTLLSDDRGRGLCRSAPQLGSAAVGHGRNTETGHADHAPAPGPPPETYPDDRPILGISSCRINERVRKGERLRFDATYLNDRPRSGVMGIFSFYVWEGGGPADPVRR